jgi:hypothetical protein
MSQTSFAMAIICGVTLFIASAMCFWYSGSIQKMWVRSGSPAKSSAPLLNEWPMWRYIGLGLLGTAAGVAFYVSYMLNA